MGGQVAGGRHQRRNPVQVRTARPVKTISCLDHLDGVEIPVLPQKQAAQHRLEPPGVTAPVKVPSDQPAGLVDPLLLVEQGFEFGQELSGI